MGAFNEQTDRFRVRIIAVRKHRKMTQGQLAQATGLSRAAVGRIESGKRTIMLADAVYICDGLGVSLTAMLSDEPLVLTEAVRID